MESFSKNSQFFSSGKHKKALSSLVNQQQLAPNFKIIHSPSLSQTSFFSPQSTIPNISNASQMDNFINNFHTFHKYQQKKPVLKANAQIFAQKKRNFSNPNTKQDSAINVKYKEWLYNNQIENSLILLPEEIKENRNIPIGFQTFNSLSTKNSIKLAKNRQIAQKTENFIEKHLINNEIQANILKESVSRFQKEKFELLSQQIKKETQISSQLSRKILKFKRPKYSKSLVRPSEIDFFEENSENNEAFFHMYVNSINSQDANNKPWVRESSSFILINDKGYLFGGLSNKLLNSLHELDLNNFSWKKLEFCSDIELEPRLGHITVAYKHGFMIYGGEKQYNNVLRVRECLNDLRAFIVETNEWKFIKTWGDFIEGRRNHAGVLVSKYLIIYGGINNNGHYLNHLANLNLETQKWSICETENKDDPLAFHTMCPVFRSEIKIITLYHPYEHNNNNKNATMKNVIEEGIYCFGGKDRNNQCNNTLKILKIGKKPLFWLYPETYGSPPSPRYHHSMSYQENLNLMVIYGGRNDVLGIYSDIFVLRMSNMTWYNVDVHGDFLMKERFAHCCASFSDKFIVFGGVTQKGFAKGEVLVFEMNAKIVNKLIHEENLKRKQKILMDNKEKGENLQENNGENLHLIKENKEKDQTKLLIENLSFKKFRSFMPLPIKEEMKEGKGKSMSFWKKTLGGVKFLVKIQQQNRNKSQDLTISNVNFFNLKTK